MSNITTVQRIGAGERLSETATVEIVASLPDGFDPGKRGAVAEACHVWACGDSERPPVTTGGKGNQKATDYGRGIDNLTKRVKAALAPEKATDYLALVRQAVTTASNKGEHSPEAISEAVASALAALVAPEAA
jgi:hypothetical protein